MNSRKLILTAALAFVLALPGYLVAGGEIREFEAMVPENLKKAAVGDLVVAT